MAFRFLSRGLIYVLFAVAAAIGWFIHRRMKSGTKRIEPDDKLDKDDIDTIIRALDHPRWQMRLAAITALTEHANPDYLELLFWRLGDPDHDVRDAAAQAVAGYGDAAIPGLSAILAQRNLTAREAAVHTLGYIGSQATVQPLIAALQTDESVWVRIPAAQALGVLGDETATAALIAALADPIPEIVRAARDALETIGTPPALAALAQQNLSSK